NHRGVAIVDRFCKTLAEMLYKVQYTVELISSDSKLIRAWVKYLPKVINYLNNYPTRLIWAPGSSKGKLAPSEAIKLEKVESKPSISRKYAIGKNEEKLKKGDIVRYFLANAEWKSSLEVLYYLGGKYAPSRAFVRKELLYVDINTLQLPSQ
ncbi:6747_t:CDS:2, partial [Gigaspora rosea]